MLELRGAGKSFGAAVALEPTDLAIPPRQTTVLIGPSGCGKSTMLRLMIGLLEPDRGAVYFDGHEMRGENVRSLRYRMGYVIQAGGLFPHLSACDNVTLLARYLRWDRRRIDERLAELIELTRLPSELLERFPAQLSGGQRQRIGLMRALMLDPEVLLLDEPLGALDPMIRSDLQEDLKRIFQTLHKTVVLVTHDMGEAAYLGGLIVLMRAGRIVQQGAIEELISTPADRFVTQFIRAQRSPLDFAEDAPT